MQSIRKRPLCLILALYCMVLVGLRLTGGGALVFGAPHISGEAARAIKEGDSFWITGIVSEIRQSEKRQSCRLEHVSASLPGHLGKPIPIERLIVYFKSDINSYFDSNPFSVTSKKQAVSVGSRIYFDGRLSYFEPPRNPGEFNRKAYYENQRIFLLATAKEIRFIDQGSGILQFLHNIRTYIRENIRKHMAKEDAGILISMLLGERILLEDSVREAFAAGGMLHILAISGLHVSLIGFGLFRLFLRIFFRQGPAVFLSSWILLAYCLLVGSPASSLRAVLMFYIFMGARLLKRSFDIKNAWALSAWILLLNEPGMLFQSAFLLSYGAIFGMIWLEGRLFPAQKKRKQQGGMLKQLAAKALSGIRLYVSVHLVLFPLLLWHFYEIPLFGIPVNLLLLPLAGIVLGIGFLALGVCFFQMLFWNLTGILWIGRLCAAISSLMQALFFVLMQAEGVLLSGIRLFLRKIEETGGRLILGRPSVFQICLYCMLLMLLFIRSKRIRRMQKGIVILAVCILLIRIPPEFSLTMLDVGQGDCLVVRRRGGGVFLVDGGSSSVAEVGKYRIIPYLKSQGIGLVDGIFISHTDADHINGITGLLEKKEIRVKCMYLPVWMKEKQSVIQKMCTERKIRIVYWKRGDVLSENKLRIRALHPEEGRGRISGQGENASSMVLDVQYGSFRALLTGDLEGEGEEKVLEQFPPGVVTFLKAAHHGSRDSTSERFLSVVNPEWVGISAPERSRYGHPHKELLARLKQSGAHVFMTKDQGCVTLQVKKKSGGIYHLQISFFL